MCACVWPSRNFGGDGCCLRACAPGKQIKTNRTGQGCCSYYRGGPAPPPCASIKTQSECHGPSCGWNATTHMCSSVVPQPPPPPPPPPPCALLNVTTCLMPRCSWNTSLHECHTPPFAPPRQQCKSAPCIGKHSTHNNSFAPTACWAADPMHCRHSDTGILATKWLMELLSLHGRTDVGLDLVFKSEYPSWGYMAWMNSTTVAIVPLLPPLRRLPCRCWS